MRAEAKRGDEPPHEGLAWEIECGVRLGLNGRDAVDVVMAGRRVLREATDDC